MLNGYATVIVYSTCGSRVDMVQVHTFSSIFNGLVAQSGERQPVTLEVVGSKPIKVATHGPVV